MVFRSYAKVNLYLDVLAKRPDGFHDIETIFQTVSLADELSLMSQPEKVTLDCATPGLENMESNLVFKAATLLRERMGCEDGVHMDLVKRIPVAAGMAGGSGNAAAALVGLNELWQLGLDQAQLCELALELGSDVPYCVVGGTRAASGRGEVMQELPPVPKTWLVLVHPPSGISAASVYTSDALELSKEEIADGHTASFDRAVEALEQGGYPDVIFNRMEVPIFAMHPELADIKDQLLEAGCVAAAVSGSGPTVFGVCKSKRKANAVAEAFADHTTSVVHTVATGVKKTS